LLFSSDVIFNFLFIVSMKLSLFAFLFSSLDEDFPHHERIFISTIDEMTANSN
jgi:hypothetical protein